MRALPRARACASELERLRRLVPPSHLLGLLGDRTKPDASGLLLAKWAKRHDKSAMVNYVPPDVNDLERELKRVTSWFKRVRGYKK